jgi:hypothetical protein
LLAAPTALGRARRRSLGAGSPGRRPDDPAVDERDAARFEALTDVLGLLGRDGVQVGERSVERLLRDDFLGDAFRRARRNDARDEAERGAARYSIPAARACSRPSTA